jgi:Flp pilus assembly protein TadG
MTHWRDREFGMKSVRIIGNQKGVAMVEFAFVAMILIVLVLGLIEMGLLFYNQAVLTNASRVGARAAIAGESNYQTLVTDYCASNMLSTGSAQYSVPAGNVSLSTVDIPDDDRDGVAVQVTYDYNFLFADLIGLETTSVTLTGRTVMRNE